MTVHAPHTHEFTLVAHVDACHYYSSSYSCSCGAYMVCGAERDIQEDPYSAVWMDPEGREEDCARCQELMAGATPRSYSEELVEHGES